MSAKTSLVIFTVATTVNFFVVWDDMAHGILPFLGLVCLCWNCYNIGKDIGE